jgi:hypothetical protein
VQKNGGWILLAGGTKGRSEENPNAVTHPISVTSKLALTRAPLQFEPLSIPFAAWLQLTKKATIETFHAPAHCGRRGKSSIVALC